MLKERREGVEEKVRVSVRKRVVVSRSVGMSLVVEPGECRCLDKS